MLQSEVNNQNPPQIFRYYIIDDVLNMEARHVSRKRKLQTEQLELLPLTKHVCFDNAALPSKSCEPCCDNNSSSASDHCSEIDSVQDSNSFTLAEGEHATTSVNSGYMEYTHETKAESSSSSLGEEMFHNHQEFVYTEQDIEDILYPDDEVKNYNAANYVLSSGRQTVNQDSSRQSTRKPTIDQEFEQYFSMLML